jgi:hypothetical protein
VCTPDPSRYIIYWLINISRHVSVVNHTVVVGTGTCTTETFVQITFLTSKRQNQCKEVLIFANFMESGFGTDLTSLLEYRT